MTAIIPSSVIFVGTDLQCTRQQILAGSCAAPAPVVTPGLGDGGVNLGGRVNLPGAGAGAGQEAGSGGAPGTGIRGPSSGIGTGAPVDPADSWCAPNCKDGYTVTSPLTGRGPVTLADLVDFHAVAGVSRMEPDGWTVIGLDTNFFVETAAHVEDGLLLGIPASVRFTPVAFRWDYGDGVTAVRATKGSSWRAQGSAEFDPTATSHVYLSTGEYAVDLTIDFGAEYRFGPTDWIAIDGTVPVVSNRLTLTAGTATTVLVARDCASNRAGPGC